MRIKIMNVSIRYDDTALSGVSGVQVYFSGSDVDRAFTIEGYIPLTNEEYKGNESVDLLEKLVRQKVADRLLLTPQP